MSDFLDRLSKAKKEAEEKLSEKQFSNSDVAARLCDITTQIRSLLREIGKQSGLKAYKGTGKFAFESVLEGKDDYTRTGTICSLWSEDGNEVDSCFIAICDLSIGLAKNDIGLIIGSRGQKVKLDELLTEPVSTWLGLIRSHFEKAIIFYFERRAT